MIYNRIEDLDDVIYIIDKYDGKMYVMNKESLLRNANRNHHLFLVNKVNTSGNALLRLNDLGRMVVIDKDSALEYIHQMYATRIQDKCFQSFKYYNNNVNISSLTLKEIFEDYQNRIQYSQETSNV